VYILKFLVVVLCYAMSGFGMLLMFFGGMVALHFAGWGRLLLLLWPAAAIAHIYLSLAWVESRTLGWRASCAAGALGTAGIVAFPALLHFSDRGSLNPRQFLELAALESLAVLPALLLAIYLTWYHARAHRSERLRNSALARDNAA